MIFLAQYNVKIIKPANERIGLNILNKRYKTA